MYVCLYVCMYVCMYVCVCMYQCMYECMGALICLCISCHVTDCQRAPIGWERSVSASSIGFQCRDPADEIGCIYPRLEHQSSGLCIGPNECQTLRELRTFSRSCALQEQILWLLVCRV